MFKILLVFYLSTRVTRNNAYPLKGMYEEWTDDQEVYSQLSWQGSLLVFLGKTLYSHGASFYPGTWSCDGLASYPGERAKSEMLLATSTIWPDADSTLINLKRIPVHCMLTPSILSCLSHRGLVAYYTVVYWDTTDWRKLLSTIS